MKRPLVFLPASYFAAAGLLSFLFCPPAAAVVVAISSAVAVASEVI